MSESWGKIHVGPQCGEEDINSSKGSGYLSWAFSPGRAQMKGHTTFFVQKHEKTRHSDRHKFNLGHFF